MSSTQYQPSPGGIAATLSTGLCRRREVAVALQAEELKLVSRFGNPGNIDYVVGWGSKPSAEAGRRYARKHGLPYFSLEEGFLCYPPDNTERMMSIVVDDLGIYYDASKTSRLETLLNSDTGMTETLLDLASGMIQQIRDHRLSKYNGAPVLEQLPGRQHAKKILVIDQTYGDYSVTLGGADKHSFSSMLDLAIKENESADIIVKTHPRTASGDKAGYLGSSLPPRSNLWTLDESVNPISVLEHVDHVYVVTSQLGFEGLLMGVPVSCFGTPFYAGWGLTDDRCKLGHLRRSAPMSVEKMFVALYFWYTKYVLPGATAPCTPEQLVEYLIHNNINSK